jgi:hypothetical protein
MTEESFDKFYKICVESKKWEKWTNKDFDINNKTNVILTCGHYLFSDENFVKIKNKIPFNINSVVKEKIKIKLTELITIIR